MNEMFSQGGRGSTGILTNKQAIARKFGVKQSEVVYFSEGVDLGGYKVIYDKTTQRAYSLPTDISSGTTAISLGTDAVLVHSQGSVDLGELGVQREEFITVPGSFTTGATITTKNEVLTDTSGLYRWNGTLPKVVEPDSTPEKSGGIHAGAWIPVGTLATHNPIIDDIALQHKVVHDIDYSGIFEGAENLSQGFCICETPDGLRMFIHQPVTGGVRIVETTFNPEGDNENPTVISFSPVFEDIGHQSIGAVYENGNVFIYVPTADDKGINIITWKGYNTSISDIVRKEIFKSDFYSDDNIITIALSESSKTLVIETIDVPVHVHYNNDDRRIIYVFDRASLTFKYRFHINTIPMVSPQSFQGMACDDQYLYAYYGYNGVFITHRIVIYNLFTGEIVRWFNVDGVRAKYGREKMLGNAEFGYPCVQEPEGLAIYKGKLYLLDMDFWYATCDVVLFEGLYFAARTSNFSRYSPINASYWTPTTYGIGNASQWDSTKTYTRATRTKRSKAIVSVEPYDGTGYSIFGVAYPDSHASLFLSPNAVNIAISPSENFQVATYEQNLRSHRPLFEVRREAPDTDNSAAVFRLYGDAFRTGEYTGRSVQWKHRLNDVHDCLEIRADTGLSTGGGINIYSTKDTQYPGRTKFYCTDGSTINAVSFSPASPALHPDADKTINLGTSLNRWNVIHSQGLNIKSDDETQKRVLIGTTLKEGSVQVSTTGHLGVWDSSVSKYLIASRPAGTAFMQMDTDITGNFLPSTNNTYNIGSSSKAFSNAYFNNSPTVVSDATLKDEPRDINSSEIAAFAEIARLPSVWRWLQRIKEEGDDARLHSGPTVQAAIDIMTKHGLDWRKYSAFCLDSWDAVEAEYEEIPAEYEEVPVQPAIYSNEGELLSGTTLVLVRESQKVLVRPELEAGTRYRFRKEELLWWCLRATINQIDSLAETVNALVSRIDALENK